MTKEKHLLLAAAAASLAVALAACEQTTPAARAGSPAPASPPAAPAAPAPSPGGLRTEALIVAIVADPEPALSVHHPGGENGSAGQDVRVTAGSGPAGRVNAAQTSVTPDTTLSFPSDFGTPVRHSDETVHLHYEYSATLPHASITRRVIERGGITPWTSIDGGASWRAGGVQLGGGLVTLDFVYRPGDAEDGLDAAGSVTIHLSASGATAPGAIGSAHAVTNIKSYLSSNSLLIRFFLVLVTD